jgi:hypothetical protein
MQPPCVAQLLSTSPEQPDEDVTMLSRSYVCLFSSINSYAYRDVVMNFVCNLRRLGIYDQLVIAAFDEDMYRYGFRMGLPVFYYEASCS